MSDVRERRERLLQTLGSEREESPERTAAILRERARLLARPPLAVTDDADQLELVTFRLGKERYAIEARYVVTIMREVRFTPVPGLPDFFLGVTNLRGEILAVVDLARFLHIDRAESGELTRLLVLGVERPEFGIVADMIEEVPKISESMLHPPSTVLGGIPRPYLRGVTRDALIVLHGAALLEDPQLFFDEE